MSKLANQSTTGSRHGKIAKGKELFAFVLTTELRARATALALKEERSLAAWMRRCVRDRVEAEEAKDNPSEAVI